MTRKIGLIVTLGFMIASNSMGAFSAQCSAKSGHQTVPLLELYTSEGCSSCPPADQWMSKLKQSNRAVTPLAFHVDYWDYIGWKDRFAKPEYSDRQRKTAAFANSSIVYTPQFVMSGRDFRSWNDHRLNRVVSQLNQLPSQADLALDFSTQDDGSIQLTASAKTTELGDAKQADLFIALYENGLVTQVKAGENNGSALEHDFVVRQLFGAYQMNPQVALTKQFTLNTTWQNRDSGAVMFVQDRNNGEIIQSLALPFCSE